MRKKIPILLPLVQVMVAACLMWINSRRPNTLSDPAWGCPEWQVCVGLNAPAFLFANLLTGVIYRLAVDGLMDGRLGMILDVVIRLSLIWLIWYVVVVEVGGGGRSVLTSRTRFR